MPVAQEVLVVELVVIVVLVNGVHRAGLVVYVQGKRKTLLAPIRLLPIIELLFNVEPLQKKGIDAVELLVQIIIVGNMVVNILFSLWFSCIKFTSIFQKISIRNWLNNLVFCTFKEQV